MAEDEDYFPHNHPLHKYLDDLQLNDAISNDLPSFTPSDLVQKSEHHHRHHDLHWYWNILCLPLLYPTELVKNKILSHLTSIRSLHLPENAIIFDHFCAIQKTSPGLSDFVTIFAFGSLLSLIFSILTSRMLCLSVLSVLICLPVLYTAWMGVILVRLKYCTRQSVYAQQQLRSCLLFIQELYVHSSYAKSRNHTIGLYEQLQKRLASYERKYIDQLSRLILHYKAFTISDLFCSELSIDYLQHLQSHLCSSNAGLTWNECKMYHEVAGMLQVYLVDRITSVTCCLPISCFSGWIRFGLLIRRWASLLSYLDSSLWQLVQLRTSFDNGCVSANDMRDVESSIDESSTDSDEKQGIKRIVRKSHIHLLLAVSKIRELDDLLQSNAPFENPILLRDLQFHLDACQNLRMELESILVPSSSSETGASEGYVETACGKSNFELIGAHKVVAVAAKDVEPEDDFLEDVAVGSSPGGDTCDHSVEDVDLGTEFPRAVPLHASILKELRLAIQHRHLDMQERERRALEKRIQSSEKPTIPPSTLDDENETSAADVENPMKPDELLTNEKQNGTTDQPNGFPKCTNPIKNFFSESDHDDLDVSKVPLKLRQTHSTFEKRMQKFNYLKRSKNNGVDVDLDVKTYDSSPRHVVRQAHPFNPVLMDPGLACALKARRQQLGYAEEESLSTLGAGSTLCLDATDKA